MVAVGLFYHCLLDLSGWRQTPLLAWLQVFEYIMTSLNRYRDVHARIQACVGEDGQLVLSGTFNHAAHAQVRPSSGCLLAPQQPSTSC